MNNHLSLTHNGRLLQISKLSTHVHVPIPKLTAHSCGITADLKTAERVCREHGLLIVTDCTVQMQFGQLSAVFSIASASTAHFGKLQAVSRPLFRNRKGCGLSKPSTLSEAEVQSYTRDRIYLSHHSSPTTRSTNVWRLPVTCPCHLEGDNPALGLDGLPVLS